MTKLISKKAAFFLGFAIIITAGIFLRSYNFSDWMHFELDQARDSRIISDAYEKGAGELPLLGPRARGTFFRLGPIFYYFEYASAKIFGNTPPAMGYSTLFFSLLTLPLFYLYCRRYFSKYISLALLAIFCGSVFLIVYSRFPWNPNPLPFFSLLFAYSILRASDGDEKKGGWWLIVSFLSLSIATQLHSLAFVGLPIIAAIFLAIKRPHIRLKYWIMAVIFALILYVPVMINEAKTGGKNMQEFLGAISGKSEKNTIGFDRKAVVNYLENSKGYLLMLSGKNSFGFLAKDADGYENLSFEVTPDRTTSPIRSVDYALAISGLLIFSLGAVLAFRYLVKKGEDPQEKDFLMINLIWSGVIFGIFVPLVFDLSPRFFLLIAPIPFVFLGLILKFLAGHKKKIGIWLAVGIVLALLFSNSVEIKERSYELAHAGSDLASSGSDDIMKEKERVTFSQEKDIVEHIVSFSRKNGYPVYYASEPQYASAFKYLLEESEILIDGISKKNIYEKGNYFVINLTKASEDASVGEYETGYDLGSKKQFGTLVVYQLFPKESAITAVEQDFNQTKKKPSSKTPKRYIWREIFNNSQDAGDNSDEDGGEQ